MVRIEGELDTVDVPGEETETDDLEVEERDVCLDLCDLLTLTDLLTPKDFLLLVLALDRLGLPVIMDSTIILLIGEVELRA